MYPQSLLAWVGGTAVLMGIIGLIGLLALAVDNWHKKRQAKGEDDE